MARVGRAVEDRADIDGYSVEPEPRVRTECESRFFALSRSVVRLPRCRMKRHHDGAGNKIISQAGDRIAPLTGPALRQSGLPDRVESGCGAVTVGRACLFSSPFVWRCLSGSTIAPFPHPSHRTGHADFPASGSRTRSHAFAHGTSRPSRVRRTSPKVS